MAQGFDRRAPTEDNLRGAEAIDPVTTQVPNIGGPTQVRAPTDTFGDKIAESVGRYATGALAEAQEKRNRRSMIEGQLEAAQGKTFDQVQMDGDKWKIEGYRGMVAQSTVASMVRAQEQEIASGAYEQDPDSYRQRLVDRVTAATDGVQDPRTRELVTEAMMGQMPALMDAHMKQHLGFQENQAFDALAQSVDIMSRDKGSADQLVAFASGTSEASQGLSDARRKEAVTQGVVNAFRNGNPNAYAHLEAAGLLTTENLTAQQLNTIESAKSSFHNRKTQEWNKEHHEEDIRIMERVNSGKLDPARAVELRIENDARHGRLTTGAQAGQLYDAARAGVEYSQGTRGLNIQAAGLQGDYRTQASLLTDAVQHQESRGNPNAVSPKGATGLMQLMPATAENPGYGLPNIHQIAAQMGEPAGSVQELMRNPRVNKRMGDMYLEKMLELNKGDVELALISYNAGYGRAKEFVAAGRNWDNIPDTNSKGQKTWKHESRDYVAKITGSIQDDRADPEGARQMAIERVKQAREAVALSAYEATYPTLARIEAEFRQDGDVQKYQDLNREVFEQHGRQMDMQWLQAEGAIVTSVVRQIADDQERGVATQNQIDFAVQAAPYDLAWEQTLASAEKGDITDVQMQEQMRANLAGRTALAEQYGIELDAGEGQRRASMVTRAYEALRTGHEARVNKAVREQAAIRGTAEALPADQQEQLVKETDQQLMQQMQNAVASRNLSPEDAEQAFRVQRSKALAEMGVVDDRTKRVLNVGLAQPPMVDGELNPAFAEAVESYAVMRETRPSIADRYVDQHNQALVDSVLAATQGTGSIEAAIHAHATRYQQHLDNPNAFSTSDEVIASSGKQISRAVKTFVRDSDPGLLRSAFSSRSTGTEQSRNRMNFDRQVYTDTLTSAIETEVQNVHQHHPYMKPDDIVSAAAARVGRRHAIVGTDIVDFGMDIHSEMFGGREAEMAGNLDSVNAAFMTYFRSDQFKQDYPGYESVTQLTDPSFTGRALTGLANAIPGAGLFMGPNNETGVRPFHVSPIMDGRGGVVLGVWFDNPDGSSTPPIRVDPKRAGQVYLDHIRNK